MLFGKVCWRWSASCLACLDPEQLCVCQLESWFVGDSVAWFALLDERRVEKS